jgi:integrase
MYLLKRNKIFHLFYKDEAGKLHSVSTRCHRKSDANKFAVQYLQQLKENSKKKTILTYGEFKEFYKTYASSRFTKRYQEFVGYAFQQFERIVGKEILLKNITELHIEEFIKLKLSEAGQRIVNGYLRTLQGAFQRAVDLGFLYNNIFKNVKKLKPEQNPPLFLSREDFEKIVAAEENYKLKFLYRFAVLTGMRMGEIRFLRWDAIDFQKGVIQIRNHNEFTTKSKKARVIPIHPLLINQLQDMKNGISDNYVFQMDSKPIDRRRLSEWFKNAGKKAKIFTEYHFHSLRHTFASWLVQRGVSIYEVSKLLGHADIKTTQIYAHLRSDDLRNAVERLD